MASAFADAIFVAETEEHFDLAQLREWLAEHMVSHLVLDDVDLLEDRLVEDATELGAGLSIELLGTLEERQDGFEEVLLAELHPPVLRHGSFDVKELVILPAV